MQALRAAFATIEVACFYWAVAYLPLADVMAFYLAGPIFVTAIAGAVLGEPVGWRRWAAVGAGFVGVIVCLRPGAATLTWPALIALAGSFTFSLSMIATRYLRGTSDTVLVTTQTVSALAFGAVVAPFAWTPPGAGDLALLALLGIVAMVAHVCVNRSLKLAPASTVVPYQYTTIIWAPGCWPARPSSSRRACSSICASGAWRGANRRSPSRRPSLLGAAFARCGARRRLLVQAPAGCSADTECPRAWRGIGLPSAAIVRCED
jgi:hypothetical protein